MQKAVLKLQFKAFTISNQRVRKGYDRFQRLLSQLEAHGAEVSTEMPITSFSDLYPQLGFLSRNSQVPQNHLQCLKNVAFVSQSKSSTNKHLREVPKNKATSTNSVNSGSGQDNMQPAHQDDSDMPELTIFNKPQKGIFDEISYDDEGLVQDFNNLPIEVAEEPKKISEALKDDCWVEAIQEELLQFRLQQVWILVDLPHGAKEEGIDYDEVFAPVARIKAIRLFLAFASFMGFIVYQMDVKSAFLYGIIDEEVFVSQLPCFVDPAHPKKVYKVVKALYGLHQALESNPIWDLWYPRESSFELKVTQICDYVGAILDSAASCCGQVLWIQNQMLDYGFNFMNTKIHIDNESTICIVKNLVYHSKTKHIEIRHHFIRDSYEKKLIRVEKIHTDFNVADLLTKAFDGPRFNFLVVNIGQPLSPRQETAVPHSQDPTHPHVPEARTMTVEDLLHLVPNLITKVDSLETELKQTKLTMGKAIVQTKGSGEDNSALLNDLSSKGELCYPPKPSARLGREISPTTLEAAKTLSKVASQRSKSVDKGKRYKMRKESKGKDIDSGFGDISTGLEHVNTDSEEVNTDGLGVV
ncbi:putative ribonuclease H-like domain-containing protein [Tanacetum coccineum]